MGEIYNMGRWDENSLDHTRPKSQAWSAYQCTGGVGRHFPVRAAANWRTTLSISESESSQSPFSPSPLLFPFSPSLCLSVSMYVSLFCVSVCLPRSVSPARSLSANGVLPASGPWSRLLGWHQCPSALPVRQKSNRSSAPRASPLHRYLPSPV
jgi:hypothetical protein